jgi:hypothetical protein
VLTARGGSGSRPIIEPEPEAAKRKAIGLGLVRLAYPLLIPTASRFLLATLIIFSPMGFFQSTFPYLRFLCEMLSLIIHPLSFALDTPSLKYSLRAFVI